MIFRSPFADVTIPGVPLTSYIFHHAWERADKPALIDGASGRALTYGQLTDAIYRAAAGLAARGFRRGEVFAIHCPNLLEYAVVFHLEALLLTHSAVADAAVIGRPGAEAGEVPIAFVVLQGNATSQELMGFVSERVAPYKRLRHVACVAQIPKSPTGETCDGGWSSRSRQASVRFEAAVQCRQRRDIALAVDNLGSWSGLAAFPAPAGAL